MTNRFDPKVQARSMSRLLEMADECMTRPGGSIHSERLIDYTSGELAKLPIEQCLQVLGEMDKNYQKNILTDGNGGIIGFVFSKRIFVTLRRETPGADGQSGNAFAQLAKQWRAADDFALSAKPPAKAKAKNSMRAAAAKGTKSSKSTKGTRGAKKAK
mgnify:CR=1 FL=1